MGMRGFGSTNANGEGRKEVAARLAKAKPRPMPWKRPGLSRAARVIKFIEWLPVTKGHLAGKKIKLLPEQREFLESIYGPKSTVKIGVLSAPRGNGKTGLLAPLTLCHLLGPEAVERGECYSAAVDRDQAALMFSEMEAVINVVDELFVRTNTIRHKRRIEVLSGDGVGSIYQALSSDARRGHGLASSFWSFDELAQVANRHLLSALETSMGKQKRSLGIVISTQAPDDDHPLSQMIDDGLEGADPTVLVRLYSAPDHLDPYDPATWKVCNFALGKFLDQETLRSEAERARRVPSMLSSFRNLRLNQRVAADERLIGRDDWLGCKGPIDRDALRGKRCWGGLDLSSTTDLSALVLVFESGEVLPWFWMPKGGVEALEHGDHKNYSLWVDQGFIETTPGRAIDKTAIALKLAEVGALYDVQAVGFDEWRFADLEKIIHDQGLRLPLKPMRQGFKTMAACVDALEGAVVDRQIIHDGNPPLTMCISNACVETDPAGNRKLSKKRSRSRIDGAVCLAMALGLRATELEAPATERYFSDAMTDWLNVA